MKDEETQRSNTTFASSTSEKGKFAFSPDQLSALYNPRKSLAAFCALGGLQGLENGLRTDRRSGLSVDETTIYGFAAFDGTNGPPRGGLLRRRTASLLGLQSGPRGDHQPFADRKCIFLDNHLPKRRTPSFLRLVWLTYNDPVLFLLTAAAAVSLAIGIYQAFTPNNPPVEWIEGVAILVAIVLIVLIGSINDYQKQCRFKKLNEKQLERKIKVVRSSLSRLISKSDLLVGDVVHLEPGDVMPADGILINGHNIICDESSVTGESDFVHKHAGDDVFQAIANVDDPLDPSISELDPFILSGTKVVEGIGTFLVTATGINSTYGKTLLSLQEDPEYTPLQVRLNVLAKHIARIGGALALLLFFILFIKFLVIISHGFQTPAQKGQIFIDIIIISLTVLVIAVPEGLPLAVTLSLAFAMTKMLKDNNLVRHLKACETMGNATNICSDKTGTLTQNKMVVVAGTVGTNLFFHDEPDSATTFIEDEIVSSDAFTRMLSEEVRLLLKQSIALNSTAFEDENGQFFIGSSTESALLAFARDHLGMGLARIERAAGTITQLIPFNRARQCMATVIQLPSSKGRFRVLVKGASEILLAKCSKIIRYDTEMSDHDRQFLMEMIGNYAGQSLRTISLAYRDFDAPATDDHALEKSKREFTLDYLLHDLVFLTVIGIKDPLRPGVPQAVQSCQRAGVTVRMVTGDNLRTAKTIAEQCGILSNNENDIIMEGAQFRTLSPPAMDRVIPHLKVLARSSPSDKQTLVVKLKEMGEIVAVTGDGANDASALSAADISFSMGGISGTEVAREASSIILMNDDFTYIVRALLWGRAVNDSVKKFLVFQITITFTSVLLTSVSAIANSTGHSVLTAVQLMWVNLVQDTLAALAFAKDAPQPRVLDRKPEPKSAPLINTAMWKMIVGQSIYQLAVTLVLYFAGAAIFSYNTDLENKQLQTVVFNTYVWLQIFNMYNNRQYDNTLNIFEGILRNWLFMAVSVTMIGAQILIIFLGGQAFSVAPLTGAQWAISIVLGLLSLPIGALIRLIPDTPLERICGTVTLGKSMNFSRRRLGHTSSSFSGSMGSVHQRLSRKLTTIVDYEQADDLWRTEHIKFSSKIGFGDS